MQSRKYDSPSDQARYAALNAEYANKQRIAADVKNTAEINRQAASQAALQRLSADRGPGYNAIAQSAIEKQAGLVPAGYEGTRDVKTGKLLDQFKINPFAGKASGMLRDEAFSTGPSAWASMALQKQKFEEGQARGNAGLQQQQAQSNAQSQLMRLGGMGGGARTSLARSGARDALMANQNVGAQGLLSRFGINQQDQERRQTLLGQNADLERQADLKNMGTTQADMERRQAFDINRYNEQMRGWAANQSAGAIKAAGG